MFNADTALNVLIIGGIWTTFLSVIVNSYRKSHNDMKETVISHDRDLIRLKEKVVSEDKIRHLIHEQLTDIKTAHEDIKDDIKVMLREMHKMEGSMSTLLQEIRRR